MTRGILALAVGVMLTLGAGVASMSASPAPKGVVTKIVVLHPVAQSGVTGQTAFNYDPTTHITTAQLVVHHLKPHSRHQAHIHLGRCGDNGPIVYGFSILHADAKGTAVSSRLVLHHVTFQGKRWYVNVHTGLNLQNKGQFQPLACGNVT